jgi:hypothetical protein
LNLRGKKKEKRKRKRKRNQVEDKIPKKGGVKKHRSGVHEFTAAACHSWGREGEDQYAYFICILVWVGNINRG